MRRLAAAVLTVALGVFAQGCDGECIVTDPIFVEDQLPPVCLFGARPVGGTAGWMCSCPGS